MWEGRTKRANGLSLRESDGGDRRRQVVGGRFSRRDTVASENDWWKSQVRNRDYKLAGQTGAMNADSAFYASNWPLIDEACRSSGERAAGPRLICCVNSDQQRRHPFLQSTHIIVESNEALQTYIQQYCAVAGRKLFHQCFALPLQTKTHLFKKFCPPYAAGITPTRLTWWLHGLFKCFSDFFLLTSF